MLGSYTTELNPDRAMPVTFSCPASRSPKLQQTRYSNVKYMMAGARHAETLQWIHAHRRPRHAKWSAHSPHVSSGSLLLSRIIRTAAQCGQDTSLIDTQLHSSMHLISGYLHSTPVLWLPALANVAPPSLRRKEQATRCFRSNWPVYADVFEHPTPRLASRQPIWSDMTPVDTTAQWREDW